MDESSVNRLSPQSVQFNPIAGHRAVVALQNEMFKVGGDCSGALQ
jgi:hypothetical protein